MEADVTDAITQTETKLRSVSIYVPVVCIGIAVFLFLFHLVHILISLDVYGENNYKYKWWYHISYNIWFSDHYICVQHYVVVVVRHSPQY